eukprot:TRINITY_DN3097_c0_g1_i5.p1 TRINITY_DN3097_c0_g1~~TRINITY_DN3097_c0_g1_i5.p1  ORF type:complete len:436 (+),score=-2.06 TRINITY_DN3097_c0_g1_i5:57-1364(+)
MAPIASEAVITDPAEISESASGHHHRSHHGAHRRHHRSTANDDSPIETDTDPKPAKGAPAMLKDGGASSDDDVAGDGDDFDYAAPPPFSLADLRAAIPKHCWEKNAWWSLSYFVLDVCLIIIIGALAYAADSWLVWSTYHLFQGIAMSCLFVVGHDCNHGSFSNSKLLNDIIGHISHTVLLTPYHGWRISHRTHHSNHGHCENDETWTPVTKDVLENMSWKKYLRYNMPIAYFGFPLYLWIRTPGKTGNHFDPRSPLFEPKDAVEVVTSAVLWFLTLGVYLYLTVTQPYLMINLYWAPYLQHILWLAASTYLHHHGYKKKLPWYRGEEWTYLRGALTTLDRDYGILEIFSHCIGIHVVHHLFPAIPHYHLLESTEAVKPILGKYYREPDPCPGIFPLHLFPVVRISIQKDHYVADTGEILYYQKDEKMKFLPWPW